MADPRADMAALRGIGVAPPTRSAAPNASTADSSTAATPPSTPSTPRNSGRPVKRSIAERSPAEPPEPVEEGRRSRHTTVYLEAAARARLAEGLETDPDATVADVMLGAVRAGIGTLRAGRPPTPAVPTDDPIPPPPRRRRRRRVADGRAVPVRFTTAERQALDRLSRELDMSVSGLISAALVLPAPQRSGRPEAGS